LIDVYQKVLGEKMNPCFVDFLNKQVSKTQSYVNKVKNYLFGWFKKEEAKNQDDQPYTPPEGYVSELEAISEAFKLSMQNPGNSYRVIKDGRGFAKVERFDLDTKQIKKNKDDHPSIPLVSMPKPDVQIVDFARIGSRACAVCPYCRSTIMPDISVEAESYKIEMGSEAAKFFEEQKKQILDEEEKKRKGLQ